MSNPNPQEAARLNELDKDEWRDVARRMRLDITDDQFDADWAEFVAMKNRQRAN